MANGTRVNLSQAGILMMLSFVGLAFFTACSAVERPTVREPLPPVLQDSGKVALAGVRSSHYGIKPFPEPEGWTKAIQTMSGYFEGALPSAVWIVGGFKRPKDCHLYFPGDGKEYPNIEFDTEDIHERYLSAFDKAGIKVFLQVEPAHADLPTLIDLVLGRYKHHECVIGFGVDVEWYKEADFPERGGKVDDATAKLWEDRVKSHNPAYRLFLKHWDELWMPEKYRGDIVFVDDSQIFADFDSLVTEFASGWAAHFYPQTVMFQIGYPSDKPWWKMLDTPPQTIGEAIRKRVKQDCGIIWVDFTLRDVLPVDEKKVEPIVGVKIYDDRGNFEQLFREWESLGINTALVSDTLLANAEFRTMAKKNGVALFVIAPIFQNPEELQKQPDLAAVTDRGEPAREDWVQFVCPTRKDYRNRRIEYVMKLVEEFDPDGVSLDFIRFFVFWEMVHPERTPESLPRTCFCASCLEDFQKTEKIDLPGNLSGTAEKARWVLDNHPREWTAWKCRVITNTVKDLAEAARKIKPGIKINVHTVPWREEDFGGAAEAVAGQNVVQLAGLVDYISPMCYHHMVERSPEWIHSVVADVFDRTRGDVIPSIQVDKTYTERELSAAEFKAALDEAMKPPSKGVIFWNWDALAKSTEKKQSVQSITRRE